MNSIQTSSRGMQVSMPFEPHPSMWPKILGTAIRTTGLVLECSHKTDNRKFLKRSPIMNKLSRRSILAGLAATSVIAKSIHVKAESNIPPFATSARKLYLYIHGAAVLEVKRNGLVFHAPKVTMSGNLAHDYRAGYGAKGEGDEVYPGCPLALLGVRNASSMIKIDNTTIPCLGPRTLDASQNQCSLITPIPANLEALRKIPWDSSCGDLFPGISDLQQLRYLPTVLRADFDLSS